MTTGNIRGRIESSGIELTNFWPVQPLCIAMVNTSCTEQAMAPKFNFVVVICAYATGVILKQLSGAGGFTNAPTVIADPSGLFVVKNSIMEFELLRRLFRHNLFIRCSI